MDKNAVQPWTIWFTLILLAAAAIGYIVMPAVMLSVVGISSTPISDFLVRTLAAAFIAMIPIAWSVRRRRGTSQERAILIGLAAYMIAGSGVDLHAYLVGVVGHAALPSIGLRTAVGLALLWLAL